MSGTKTTIKKKEKKFTISEIIAMIPTDNEGERYANGAFGYDIHSSDKENAFCSGLDWTRNEIIQKLNKTN